MPSNFKPTNLAVGWNGLVFDTDRGLGLAMWKSEESYIDVQHIINKVGEDTFTALHNPGLNDCRDGDCDEKLVRLLHNTSDMIFTFSTWLITIHRRCGSKYLVAQPSNSSTFQLTTGIFLS